MSVHGLLMSEAPLWTGAVAAYPYSDKLAKRYSAVSRFGDPYLMYQRNGQEIYLPRACCPVANDDRRADGKKVSFTDKFVPRNDEQVRILTECYGFLSQGLSGILEAATGVGKTVLACKLISMLELKTLVIVPKEDLMDSWRLAFKDILGLKPSEIGLIQQDTCSVVGKKVVLSMIHSVSIDGRYPAGTFDDFGMVIWDEVHRVAADSFSKTGYLFPAKLRLGLSATPERADGKETLLFGHIGPVRVRSKPLPMTPKVLVFTSNWHCPRVSRWDPDQHRHKIVKLPHSPGKITHVLQDLAKDTNRNALIAKVTLMAYSKGRNTVVFSELLDHLDTLRLTLKEMGVAWNDMALYVGGMKSKEREAASVKKVVLATYAMMAEGTNCPWLSTAVFATPRSNVQQVAGRALREYPDKPQPVLIDIVDLDSPVLAGYAAKRERWYRSIGAPIVRM